MGTPDGGIAVYEASTKRRLLAVPGDGTGETIDVGWIDGRPWWTQGGPLVHTLDRDFRTRVDIDAGIGAISRLGIWKNLAVVYSSTQFRFIDPLRRKVQTPRDVLPPKVAHEAEQGVVTTSWRNGQGILLLARRFGQRTKMVPGENADVALVNGWSSDYQLLGGYACDLLAFKDAPGPRVHVEMGPQTRDLPFGTASLLNLSVSDEGFVGLGANELLAVPFLKSRDWEPRHVKVAVPPAYSQTLCQVDSTVWWTDGKRLLRASLENGDTDVFLSRSAKPSPIRQIVADDVGAWVRTDTGIVRVQPGTYVRYVAGPEAAQPTGPTLKRLSRAVTELTRKRVSKQTFVARALKATGYRSKRSLAELAPVPGDELRYGDVVMESGRLGFYVGNGEVAVGDRKPEPLHLTAATRIVRPLGAGTGSWNGDDIFPVGLGAPCASLGYPTYAEITQEGPYDHPYLPEYDRMAEILEGWIGTPYRWGGNDYDGVDCSGLVCAVFGELGVRLPRYSQDIGRAKVGKVVYDQLRYGDVLVYSWPHRHCAIYVGNGEVVEAISGGVTRHRLQGYTFGIVRRFIDG